jgi:hypothetical protein
MNGATLRILCFWEKPGKVDRLMKENIYSPSLPLSSWIEPSQDFLGIYKTNEDLYLACVSVDFCDANLAVESLASGLQASPDILSDLWNLGVKTHASGYFDFELDDQTERWLQCGTDRWKRCSFGSWGSSPRSGGFIRVKWMPARHRCIF